MQDQTRIIGKLNNREVAELFADRDEEIGFFLEMLHEQIQYRIMVVTDRPHFVWEKDTNVELRGTGKSWLLRRLHDQHAVDGAVTMRGKKIKSMLFDWERQRDDELDIMEAIYARLVGPLNDEHGCFTSYFRLVSAPIFLPFPNSAMTEPRQSWLASESLYDFREIKDSQIRIAEQIVEMTINIPEDRARLYRKRPWVREAFFEGLRSYLALHPSDMLVLFFDTVEKAPHMRKWFDRLREAVVAKQLPNLIVVVSGKENPFEPTFQEETVKEMALGYLSESQKCDFLAKLEMCFGVLPEDARDVLLRTACSALEFCVLFVDCLYKIQAV